MKDERYPYWGVCEVEGCDEESCGGGSGWRETGYWALCRDHHKMALAGSKQPQMKPEAVAREATRDKVTGCLP